MSAQTLPRPDISSVSSAPDAPPPSRRRPRRPLLLAAAVAVVAAAAVAVVLLTGGGPERLEIGKPRIVSSGQLSSYAESAGRPVYWAGEAADGYKLELTEVRGQRVFVRYLVDGAKAGDPRPEFTTVATYPMQDAYDRLRDSADRPGAVDGETDAGAATLYYKKTPSSVYVAHQDSDQLIEVYAPQPRAALQLATSPSLQPVR